MGVVRGKIFRDSEMVQTSAQVGGSLEGEWVKVSAEELMNKCDESRGFHWNGCGCFRKRDHYTLVSIPRFQLEEMEQKLSVAVKALEQIETASLAQKADWHEIVSVVIGVSGNALARIRNLDKQR